MEGRELLTLVPQLLQNLKVYASTRRVTITGAIRRRRWPIGRLEQSKVFALPPIDDSWHFEARICC